MLSSDKTLIINKLITLNIYLEEDKERLEKDIAYWEEQVEKFGESEIILDNTYGGVLEEVKEKLECKLKEIEENHKLIDTLIKKKGGKERDETD